MNETSRVDSHGQRNHHQLCVRTVASSEAQQSTKLLTASHE